MEKYDIYQDVAKRTDGDIYVGVVGPVRTGKSTFVKRFTELLVLPNVAGKNKKQIATDELPQSGAGKTITTTEPKFIPGEAVKVTLRGKTTAKMRLIDCVGFMVDGALGHEEDGAVRLVSTPWDSEPIPFEEAAEKGTDKVIRDHSTIGIVVTTDGTITEIPREGYVSAEEKTVERLREIGKPFAIVVNSKEPRSKACAELVTALEEKYGVSVTAMDVLGDDETKFAEVLEKVLYEFPVNVVDVDFPDWLRALPPEEKVVSEILECVRTAARDVVKMKDCYKIEEAVAKVDRVVPSAMRVSAGDGKAEIDLALDKTLFYDVLSATCGETIDGEYKLMSFVRDLSKAKWEYDRIKTALAEAEEKGYGIVLPSQKEVEVDSPQIVRRGNGYGVKIDAKAESLHVIKIGVSSSVLPVSGSKRQCEEFVRYLEEESADGNLADVNVFGKRLGQLVSEEVGVKSSALPDDTRIKLRKSVNKMINDKKYRYFCFVC